MNTINPIGALAEKIVAVKIDRHGSLTPILRQRLANGRMTDCAGTEISGANATNGAEFCARVAPGSSGLVIMRSTLWGDPDRYQSPLVPVGAARPFVDFDPSSPESFDADLDGQASPSSADEVRFHYSGGKLAWTNGNTTGEMRIDESFPELTVALRLPPGNEGEISFASPLFTTAGGEHISVLSVA